LVSALPMWSPMLIFLSVFMISLFIHMSSRGRILLLYVDDMIITDDDPKYIAFIKARLSNQFLISDLDLLSYFLEIEISHI
jgi:hypothetical protein